MQSKLSRHIPLIGIVGALTALFIFHSARNKQHPPAFKRAAAGRPIIPVPKDLANAIRSNNLPQLKKLLANLTPQQLDDMRLLDNAAGSGSSEYVAFLLDRGCNSNGTHGMGSPLRGAAISGKSDTVKLLLRRGANLHLPDSEGCLISAVQSKNMAVCEQLLAAGASINAQEKDGKLTVLPGPKVKKITNVITASFGDMRMERMMAQRNRGELKYVTPIMRAAWDGNESLVALLLKYHPNLDLKTAKRETALDLARISGNPKVVALLEAEIAYRANGEGLKH